MARPTWERVIQCPLQDTKFKSFNLPYPHAIRSFCLVVPNFHSYLNRNIYYCCKRKPTTASLLGFYCLIFPPTILGNQWMWSFGPHISEFCDSKCARGLWTECASINGCSFRPALHFTFCRPVSLLASAHVFSSPLSSNWDIWHLC